MAVEVDALILGKEGTGKRTFVGKCIKSHKLNTLFQDTKFDNKDVIEIYFRIDNLENKDYHSLYEYKIMILFYSNDIKYDNHWFNQYIKWYTINITKNLRNVQIVFICNEINGESQNNLNRNGEFKQICQEYGFKHYSLSVLNDESKCNDIVRDILREYYLDYYPITYHNILNNNNNNICNNIGNKFYDILTILISLLDLGTDLWVLYQYYIKQRRTFFIIGTIIICVAQMVYVIAFLMKFGRWSWGICRKIGNFFFLLAISPLLGILFYAFAANKDGHCFFVDVWLEDCLDLDVSITNYNNKKRSKAWRWINEKIEKHIGFILESVFEAFPKLI